MKMSINTSGEQPLAGRYILNTLTGALVNSVAGWLRPFRVITTLGAVVAFSTIALHTPNAAAALDQEHNFESGFTMNCSGNCPTVTTKYAREGKYSMESYVNRLTSTSSFRTEATLKTNPKMEFNKDYWYGYSIYLPYGWEVPDKFELLTQIHYTPDSGTPGSPPFGIYSGTGSWKVSNTNHLGEKKEWLLNSVYEDVGKWTDWVIHFKPSYESQGVLEVWKDGLLVATRYGSNTMQNKVGPYFKMGLYVGWKDRTCCNDKSPEKRVYHDALRIASGPTATYSDVAPRNAATTPTPGSTPEPVPEPTLATGSTDNVTYSKHKGPVKSR
jgi:Polysaccharide lyase